MNEELIRQLAAAIEKADQSDLTDGGRYFVEHLTDLTRCRHGETGEYLCEADGQLVEILWNNRHTFLNTLRHLAPLVEALKPFALIAELDIGDDEVDSDLFRPLTHNFAPHITVGHLRAASAALAPFQKETDSPASDPEDYCEGCGNGDKVPASGYWRCPKCDAEWPGEA